MQTPLLLCSPPQPLSVISALGTTCFEHSAVFDVALLLSSGAVFIPIPHCVLGTWLQSASLICSIGRSWQDLSPLPWLHRIFPGQQQLLLGLADLTSFTGSLITFWDGVDHLN